MGDLSLIAALARPDSAEATAPLSIHPALARGRAPVDPDSELEEFSHAAMSSGPAPPDESSKGKGTQTGNANEKLARLAEPARSHSRATLAVAVVAAAAIAAGIGVVAGSLRHSGRSPTKPVASGPGRTFSVPAPAGGPAKLASVAATGGSTALPTDAPATPPPPLDVNLCARAALPPGTLGASTDLGFLCSQTELWAMTRKLDLEIIKRGKGPGVVLWAHLGRFDLAAVAILRERCCPGAAPLTAATPKGLCESLTASIREASHDPSAPRVDQYAADVECLVSHGVRYPAEWWDRITEKDARSYFAEYLASVSAPR